MNIYTSGKQIIMTPAHNYAATTDFATILNDMKRGEFPVGTGKPFPVNFDVQTENGEVVDPMSPWTAHRTSNLSEPPASQIIGPRAFGL